MCPYLDSPGGASGKEPTYQCRRFKRWNSIPGSGKSPGVGHGNIFQYWGSSTGTTQRDGTGREEGGGFRMGNTCIPVADSF